MESYQNYFCLNKETYEKEMPSSFTKFSIDGKIPTWKNAILSGKLYGSQWSHDEKFVIVRGTFSSLKGELSALKDLGKDLEYPNNSILTQNEAVKLINSDIFQRKFTNPPL